jgi:hypothetical protein
MLPAINGYFLYLIPIVIIENSIVYLNDYWKSIAFTLIVELICGLK